MENSTRNFLSQLHVFSLLPEDELTLVADAAVLRSFPSGKILFTQGGAKVDGIYILREGEIELYYERDEQKSQRTSLLAGDIFGGIAVLVNSGVTVRTVRVAQETECYVIPVDLFEKLCQKYDFFHKYFLDTFAKRMVDQSYASIFALHHAYQFLTSINPFSFLPEKELEEIANQLSMAFYPSDTTVFIQGLSEIESLYIIQDGAAERYFEEAGKKINSVLMSEGDLFGGISMLINNAIAIRSLRTLEETHFYVWPKKYFLEICKRYDYFLAFFTDTFGKRMLDRSYASIIAKSIQPGEESHQFLNQPVSSITQTDLVFCPGTTTIQRAAELMSRHKSGSILVSTEQGGYAGIVTDNDLRSKVIAGGLRISRPVTEIMSSPLRTIPAQALIFEAVMTMIQGKIKHLGVTGAEDQVIGIVTNKNILTAQGQSPLFLIREIGMAGDISGLKRQHQLLPGVIRNLISNGAKAGSLTRLITTISDAILTKIVTLALAKHGPPPGSFAFMVMGSEGRKEQTLCTDQDNALIYDDAGSQEYFLPLADTICSWLNEVGYNFCKGQIMAKNPQWCQPLSEWKKYFNSWVRAAEPEDILSSTIFFDFRCAYGRSELVAELRSSLREVLGEWPYFLKYLAINAQRFKPPIGFFRNFIVASKGEHRDSFDIKKVMVPIIDFARIHALKLGLSETNTLERLHQVFLQGAISRDFYQETEQAYSFLMQLRFSRQINAIMVEKTAPDNYINPKKLTRIERTMLKEIFARIDTMQKEISYSVD
jgi:CBS domain-containing protein